MFNKMSLKVLGALGTLLQYGCVTHCALEYIGDFVVCTGPSMEPTIYSNDVLLTEHISPRLERISKGDIVIAKCPSNPRQHICKRVLGTPGDKIHDGFTTYIGEFPPVPDEGGATYQYRRLYGRSIHPNPEKTHSVYPSNYKCDQKSYPNVPLGHVWLEGDNRNNSSDSRMYGPVPQGLLRGRAMCKVWPPNDITVFARRHAQHD